MVMKKSKIFFKPGFKSMAMCPYSNEHESGQAKCYERFSGQKMKNHRGAFELSPLTRRSHLNFVP